MVFENVKFFCHQRAIDNYERPADIVMKKMSQLGYLGSFQLHNTASYGLPQSRSRVYMLFMASEEFGTNEDFDTAMKGSMALFRMKPCKLSQCLLATAPDPDSAKPRERKAKGS